MSRPRKYLIRITATIAVEDEGGRERLALLEFPRARYTYLRSPGEILGFVGLEIQRGFTELERKLDLAVAQGDKSPVEKLHGRRKR